MGRRKQEVAVLATVAALLGIVSYARGARWTEQDFAQLLLLQAQASGMKLEPENMPVNDGLG